MGIFPTIGPSLIPDRVPAILPIGEARERRGGEAYSTIISPFMTIQWPGKVQR